MYSLINIKATNSSLRSPIAFFNSFFTKNLILKAKESFLSKFPNPQDEHDLWNSYPVSIDFKKQTFSVEYIIEFYNEETNSQNSKHIIEEYTFESEIEKLFRSEFEKSKKLILQKYLPLNDENNDKYKNLKEALVDELKSILKHLKQIQNAKLIDTEIIVFKRPLESLINLLYLNFINFLPSPKVNDEIVQIIKSRENSIHLYEDKILPNDFVTRILELKDITGNNIFQFENKTIAAEQLNQICFGNYRNISSPIKFISNSGAAYYMISILLKTLNISRTEIQKAKIFDLNKGNFYSNYCDTEKYRYPLKNKDSAFLIDQIFEV